MPMTAFLLQDIPADVAEYATQIARSTRREVNAVLIEMLTRATAQPTLPAAAASAPHLAAAVTSTLPVPPSPAECRPAMAAQDAEATWGNGGPDDESLALIEAMQAAESIPRG